MTIKDIANLAGVSISTVSKIVNNKDININPETRERVLKIVKEYHYTPYGMIKNASSAKTFLLGVLLRTTREMPLILNGILAAAEDSGYTILLLDSGLNPASELKHINTLCKNHVDGVIWEPVNSDSLRYEHYLSGQGIPVCCIDSQTSSAYTIDFTQMGYVLTQKLLEYKHRKLACLLKEGSHRSDLVLAGFKKCLFENKIPWQDKMALSISDPDYCQKLLAYGVTGVVSSHYLSALKLHEQMTRFHYHIPADLSVVSLKEDVHDTVCSPCISGLRIPYREFGYFVCHELIRLCEKKEDTDSEASPFTANWQFDGEDSLEIPAYLRAKKIIVAGSINTDITYNVDRLPQAGKTTVILNSTTALGGKGANQAVGAAKLGREVTLIGKTGNDTDSTLIFEMLEKEHVNTQGLHRDMKVQTGKAYIYIEQDGEGTITLLPGANASLSPEEIQKRQHLFANAGYCLLSTEIPIETVLEAARLARQYGTKNIVKPAALKTVPDELYKNIDIFIPNQEEAAVLCPQYGTLEEQAAYFLEKGPSIVIITLGHKGCYLKTREESRYFPASDFISIDTTGGADAFISALASYLTEGYPLEKCIRIANYAAGFCVSRQGVVPSLVDRNTLENYINKIEPNFLNSDQK